MTVFLIILKLVGGLLLLFAFGFLIGLLFKLERYPKQSQK